MSYIRCRIDPLRKHKGMELRHNFTPYAFPQVPACHGSFIIPVNREHGRRDGRLGLFLPR